jgi:hypothetical protein
MQTDYAAARSTRLFSPKCQCPFFQRIVDGRLAKHCGHSHRREAGRQHRQEQPGVVSHLRDEDDAVSGARTTAVKKAAIPTTANVAAWAVGSDAPGSKSAPKRKPICAPKPRRGAKREAEIRFSRARDARSAGRPFRLKVKGAAIERCKRRRRLRLTVGLQVRLHRPTLNDAFNVSARGIRHDGRGRGCVGG